MSSVVRIAAVVAGFLLSISAAKADCECGAIPAEGIYAGAGVNVAITHLDGNAEQCPQTIRIQVPRTEAPDADVALSCRGGGKYEAVEQTVVGDMGWRVQALPAGPSATRDEFRIASTVEITVIPRPGIGAPQTWQGNTSNPKAPECLCAKVRAEREFAADMVATLSDKALQEFAEGIGMRGKNPASRYALDDEGRIKKFDDTSRPKYAFMDVVSGIVNGEMSFADGEIRVYSSRDTQAARSAARAGSGRMLDTSKGDTHEVTCEIRVRQSSCPIPVMREAVRAHESVHAKNCRAQNSRERFTWIDGSPMEGWSAYHDGMALPYSPYSAWSETVAHIARDEAAAYGAELPIYDEFLGKYCSS